MASGLFRWFNKDGTYHDIDVDSLPRTSKLCNVIAPNLYIVPEGQPEAGRLYKVRFPSFRLEWSGNSGVLFLAATDITADIEFVLDPRSNYL